MKENFKTGDLVWTTQDKSWIYCIDNLPRDEAYVKQPDELVTNGLPAVFIKYIPREDWRSWMLMDVDEEQVTWCMIFYKGKEWVIDPNCITKKNPHQF